MTSSFASPPKRTAPVVSSTPSESPSTWKGKLKERSSVWGKIAMKKAEKMSDNLGGKVNDVAEKRFGTEAFWPVTGDFPKEMDKAARILRSFTVDGIVTETKLKDGSSRSKPQKVLRKIPPQVIGTAKGLAIFTSMRSGIAPFGGAGGAGIVVAKLPDGTWSAPASISPNNLSAGFLLGVDIYDCILVIRSQAALDSFKTHKATFGTEMAIAAGPFGAGAAIEAGIDKAPLLSYVRSRGVYAGIEVVGQVFVERSDENALMYAWPGVRAGDILQGKVKIPVEAADLHQALRDAESGRAQKMKGDDLDIVLPEGSDLIDLEDGEVLKLPPTPEMTDGTELGSTSARSLPRPAAPRSDGPLCSTAPPPLPTRRPIAPTQMSSESHYSDAEEGRNLEVRSLKDEETLGGESNPIMGGDVKTALDERVEEEPPAYSVPPSDTTAAENRTPPPS